MSDNNCECKDSWVYWQGGHTPTTYYACDDRAPDNNSKKWCYLNGSDAATKSCDGANTASQPYGDQLYWKECGGAAPPPAQTVIRRRKKARNTRPRYKPQKEQFKVSSMVVSDETHRRQQQFLENN